MTHPDTSGDVEKQPMIQAEYYAALTKYGTTHQEFVAQENGLDLTLFRIAGFLAELAQLQRPVAEKEEL